MTDPQILHPVFGRSVKNGCTDTCSICGGSIAEDDVPLMMWDKVNQNIMYVFCEGCGGPIFASFQFAEAAKQ